MNKKMERVLGLTICGLAMGTAVAIVFNAGAVVGKRIIRNEAVAYGHAVWTKGGFVWHATQCGCPGLGLSILPEEWAMGVDETVRRLGNEQSQLRMRIERLENEREKTK